MVVAVMTKNAQTKCNLKYLKVVWRVCTVRIYFKKARPIKGKKNNKPERISGWRMVVPLKVSPKSKYLK